MTKSAVTDWSTTAASNTDVGGINIDEGMARSSVNNAMREIMAQIAASGAASLTGWLSGLTLANNVSDATNDIDIATGSARDSTDAFTMRLGSALTKRLDAGWAVGTNQGGLDTGAIANATYHVWLIRRSDTGVVDVLFSTSASSPTMPANYDQKRRLGSIVRTGAAIKPFKQNGDVFDWVLGVLDIQTTNPGTSAVTATLTLPTGIIVRARISGNVYDATASADTYGLITSIAETDSAPASSIYSFIVVTAAGAQSVGNFYKDVMTNTSAQIRYRIGAASTADHSMHITTHGWIDTRGKDA